MTNTYNSETGWLSLNCEAFGVVSAWRNTVVPLWHELGVDTRVVPEILKFVADSEYFIYATPEFILAGIGDMSTYQDHKLVEQLDTSKFVCKIFITMNVIQYWSAKKDTNLYEQISSAEFDLQSLHISLNESGVLALEAMEKQLLIPVKQMT